MYYDLTSELAAYEAGEPKTEGVRKLFQHLVDNGEAWKLQGSYGRTAVEMIEQGFIKPPKTAHTDAYGNTVPAGYRG